MHAGRVRATVVGVDDGWWRSSWPTVMLVLVAALAVYALLGLPWALLLTR